MPGLTAKVFRTFIASDVVRGHLSSLPDVNAEPESVKLHHAKTANLQAAITCNHKRTPPASWERAMTNKRQRMQRAKEKKPQNEKQLKKWEERVKKLSLDIELTEKTKEYNLTTSLKNYIDPRIYRSWATEVGLDWTRIYSKSLLKKFAWVNQFRVSWGQLSSEPLKTAFQTRYEETSIPKIMHPPSGKRD
jgi:DNA topoisomerase-1